MTIDLTVEYPLQVDDTDPDYPLGKPRNRTGPGDATGTPWEERLVQDIVGWKQALLDEAGVTASGEPDKVGASDVVDSILALIDSNASMGTYIPTVSNTSNITGPGVTAAFHLRVGTMVFVCTWVTYTNSGSGAKSFRITLPVAPSVDFADSGRAIGILVATEASGAHVVGGVGAIVGGGTQTVGAQWSNSESSGGRSARLIFAYTLS